MTKEDTLNKLIMDAEVLADMLIDKGNEIKAFCRQAKATTDEVSTSSKKLHLERIAQDAIAKRYARIKRPKP